MHPHIRKFHEGEEFIKEINELMTIGSDASCHYLLFGEAVMERHCRIEKRLEEHIIKDLKTPNGTFVNGAKILEAILQDGDLITVGNHQLVFFKFKRAPSQMRSKNEQLKSSLERLPELAQNDHSVLITGPSGSGKDLLAQEIHRLSERRLGNFLSINCSALTESLIESELFGHIKGSFTGAIANRKGAFEAARGGTLFLDEIGDLPLTLQAKLLRALENNEIRPVGSDKTIKTDVRVLAATHQNLRSKIAKQEFREDLYYRLNVISLSLPALTDRLEDFDDIFYSLCKRARVRFSFDAIQLLKTYAWPGNIRELKNFVTRASVLYLGREVTLQQIPELINLKLHAPNLAQPQVRRSLLKELEKQMIIETLQNNRGNQKKTATQLGIPTSTLNDRVKIYGLDLKSMESSPN